MLLTLLLACTDYGFSGGTPHAGPPDSHQDDTGQPDSDGGSEGGEDSGGPPIDEDGDCDSTRTVRLGLAADDVWTAWIGGTRLGPVEQWWQTTWTEVELACGKHVLAVYATDAHQAISGFIAQVEVEGTVVAQTGDGSFRVFDTDPGDTTWRETGYDDSAWGEGQHCDRGAATSWWGSSPADLTGAGAWWIWPRDCLALGDAAFRLELVVE